MSCTLAIELQLKSAMQKSIVPSGDAGLMGPQAFVVIGSNSRLARPRGDPGARKWLRFVRAEGRRSIHLFKLEQRQADNIRAKVEAVHAGIAPDAGTAPQANLGQVA